MTGRSGRLVGLVAVGLVSSTIALGCTLPTAACEVRIAAADDPEVERIAPDAEIIVTAADVDPTGWAVEDDGGGGKAVSMTLRPDAAKRLADFTAANIGEFLAIEVNGVVVSVPVINGAIDGGALQISGGVGGDKIVEAFGPCLPIEIKPPI